MAGINNLKITGRVSEWYLRPPILLRLTLALTFLVYLRTVGFDFVFDDHYQISLNPWLESWQQVPLYFTHQLWAFTETHTQASYYRPLFMLWLAAVKHLTGGAPGWYHLATIALHLIVVAESYLLARLLLKDDLAAVFAAAIFALHPGKVEAVAWVSGGGEPLFAVFFFACFIAYLRGRESPSRLRWTLVSLLFLVLALFSKEQAIVTPVVLVAYEFSRGRPQRSLSRLRHAALVAAPWLAVAAAFWVLRWRVMHGVTEVASLISWQKTLLTQPLTWLWYLWHLAFPFHLSLFYPDLIVREFSWREVALPACAVIAMAVLVWRVARRSAEGVLLYAWFVLTLAPAAVMVLLLQPHDRYLYLPSFPAAVLLAVAIRKLSTNTTTQMIVVSALCAVLAVSTGYELSFWDNDISLFEHAVVIAPNSTRARVVLADAYTQQGEGERGAAILREAARRDPNDMDIWKELAVQEYSRGEYEQAYIDFKHAVAVAPPGRDGNELYGLGLVTLKLGRPQEAEQWARRAIALDPTLSSYHRSLAAILDAQGRHLEAEQERKLAK